MPTPHGFESEDERQEKVKQAQILRKNEEGRKEGKKRELKPKAEELNAPITSLLEDFRISGSFHEWRSYYKSTRVIKRDSADGYSEWVLNASDDLGSVEELLVVTLGFAVKDGKLMFEPAPILQVGGQLQNKDLYNNPKPIIDLFMSALERVTGLSIQTKFTPRPKRKKHFAVSSYAPLLLL